MKGWGVASMVAAIMIAVSTEASDALILAPDESRLVSEPSVAVNREGAMVVVWASRVAEGAQPLNGIRLQRFGPDGTAVGKIFRIDALPGYLAAKPAVEMAPDGSRFVVAWEGGEDGKRTKRRIWAQVFDAAGRLVGQEIRVDQRRMLHERWGLPREYYRDPRVSVAPSGEFVVVWRSEGRTSCDRFNISARRFSPDGEPMGDEFIVNTERKWSQLNPDVDHDASGGFVVVWQDGRFVGTDRERSRIVARSFDASGTAKGGEVVLTPDKGAAAALPSLVVAPNGSFACAWKEGDGDRGLERMGAGAFGAGGAPLGAPIVIKPETPGRGGPQLTIVRHFELMVAWNGTANDRFSSPAVVAQTFNAAGALTSDLFPLSPATCWGVSSPGVALSGGYGAVVWKSDFGDRIMARRFSSNDPRIDVPLTGGGNRLAQIVSAGRLVLADRGAKSGARRAAANRLFCMRETARPAYNELLQCVKGEESAVRSMCCWGLAAVAESPGHAIPQLLDIVKSRFAPGAVRAAAACTIGSFGPEGAAAVPGLVTALKDENDRVRACAGISLGKIDAYSAVDDIVAAFLEDTPSGDPVEYYRLIIQGLVELAEDARTRWALERFRRAIGWKNEYADYRANPNFDLAQPDELERYVQFFLKKRKISERRMVNYTIDETWRRISEGWVDADGYSWKPGLKQDFDDIDVIITRFLAIRNLGPMNPCEGPVVLAGGIAAVDPLPEWAVDMYSTLLTPDYRFGPCTQELLTITEKMGSKGAPFAPKIASMLRSEELSKISVIRALRATDPSCKECIVELKRLFDDPDPEIVEVAIRALIEAGPEAIRGSKFELVKMLEVESAEVREAAEEALDLIEIDAEVCDTDTDSDTDTEPALSSGLLGLVWRSAILYSRCVQPKSLKDGMPRHWPGRWRFSGRTRWSGCVPMPWPDSRWRWWRFRNRSPMPP